MHPTMGATQGVRMTPWILLAAVQQAEAAACAFDDEDCPGIRFHKLEDIDTRATSRWRRGHRP